MMSKMVANQSKSRNLLCQDLKVIQHDKMIITQDRLITQANIIMKGVIRPINLPKTRNILITIQSAEETQKITTKEMLEMTFTFIDPRHAKHPTMVMFGIEVGIAGTNIGVEIEIRCILIRGMIILPMEAKTTKILHLNTQLNRYLGVGVEDVALAATRLIVEPGGEILAPGTVHLDAGQDPDPGQVHREAAEETLRSDHGHIQDDPLLISVSRQCSCGDILQIRAEGAEVQTAMDRIDLCLQE